MRFPQIIRRTHRLLAPIMVMPLGITLLSGSLFQIAAVSGKEKQFLWLLDLHRGKFGAFNLELVYPFLNAIGLLTLLVSGIIMWLQLPARNPPTQTIHQ